MFKKFSKKQAVSMAILSVVIAAMCFPCFAEDDTATAMAASLTTVQASIMGGLKVVAPVALIVMGAFLTWKYGVKFFKGLAK